MDSAVAGKTRVGETIVSVDKRVNNKGVLRVQFTHSAGQGFTY